MSEAKFKVGIVAGEKSGDYLAAQLIRAIKRQRPNAEFVGLFCPQMLAEGATTLAEMDKISIFGLEGLLGSVREILSIRKTLFNYFANDPPDVFIGVDVPDFNLRLETKLKQLGIPVLHYVSPTVWAWRGGRIKKIARAVNHMLVLFPFEAEYYQEKGVPVTFVGHPLAHDVLSWQPPKELRSQLLDGAEQLIALLPGSRMSEVTRLAPEMFEAVLVMTKSRPAIRFVIPAANDKLHTWLTKEIREANLPITVISGQSRELLSVCDVVALASGTAALEAAMFAKPMVVMYKVAWFSALVFGHTITVEHFSMPNHLTEQPMVPELIQSQATAANLVRELDRLLDDPTHFMSMQNALSKIAPMLAQKTGELAAKTVFELSSSAATDLPN